jgi:hypothetical protein
MITGLAGGFVGDVSDTNGTGPVTGGAGGVVGGAGGGVTAGVVGVVGSVVGCVITGVVGVVDSGSDGAHPITNISAITRLKANIVDLIIIFLNNPSPFCF